MSPFTELAAGKFVCVELTALVVLLGLVAGMASLRRCWKLPLCPLEPMPAGCQTDSLLWTVVAVGAPLG